MQKIITLFSRVLVAAGIGLPGLTCAGEIGVFTGTLGPVRVVSEDGAIEAVYRGEAQRALRASLAAHFSGDEGTLYGLKVRASLLDSDHRSVGIAKANVTSASWKVTLELSELRPEKQPVASSDFELSASARGSAGSVMFRNPAAYFPEYVAMRAQIAMNEFVGLDQQAEIASLGREMGQNRGLGLMDVIVEGTAKVSVTVGKGVAGAASGMAETMKDPQTMAALNNAMENAAPSQSVDEVMSDHRREMDAIYAQKMAEAEGSAASASSGNARQQYTNSVPATASTTGTSAVVTAPSTSGRDTGSGYGSDNEESSTTSASNAKAPCVAHSESGQEVPNVPDRYCRKVFADYTGNVEFGLDEYSSEFMDESHSVDSAEETLAFKLLQKAKKQCSRRGYDRVHHDETFEYNEVAVRVNECKENNRMGSTFYLCGGTASFICAR
ncbi:MAG: hypothetical protein ABJQ78_15760 [Alloalcanivorax sp.]